ncbi:hypothetical protein TUM4445_11500 [Shewanella sp. MBTL60-112-B2]|nr:hypothetical protein TUM4444_12050 [Shewanella sp. MBTL60-112-B1]GIU29321.1 hypothetical protein TUM4445_11500 [Shewanella sp. MBTL60-112-B2]
MLSGSCVLGKVVNEHFSTLFKPCVKPSTPKEEVSVHSKEIYQRTQSESQVSLYYIDAITFDLNGQVELN